MKTSMYKRGISRALLAMLLVGSGGAFAEETQTDDSSGALTTVNGQTEAGEEVINDAVLSYDVGGVAQDEIDLQTDGDNRAKFLVDRRIDVNVTRSGGTKSGTPNGVANLTFTVTNQTNDSTTGLFLQAIRLNEDLDSLGTTRINETTDPAVTQVCLDADSDQVCDSGEELTLTADGYEITGATPGTGLEIVVEVSVPGGAADGEWDTFLLAAAVRDSSGARLIEDDNGNASPDGDGTGNNIADTANSVEDVFADAASDIYGDQSANPGIDFSGPSLTTDVASDGQHADADQFEVATSDMSITKTAEVIFDPINGLKYELVDGPEADTVVINGSADADANPKAIPGAIVMYTISAQNDRDNNDDAATATDVIVSDSLPGTIVAGNDEAVSGLTDCNADGPGVSGNGATCGTNITTLDGDLDNAIVTACDGTTSAIDMTAADPLSGVNLGSCTDGSGGAGQEGTIVYYVTIP